MVYYLRLIIITKINMKKLYLVFLYFIVMISQAQASLLDASKKFETSSPVETATETSSDMSFLDLIWELAYYCVIFFLWVGVFILFVKTIRLIFEIVWAKKLVYMKVTLPKADSKLDKEKETKKDFKEKIGMMSMYYKAIHKISEAGLKDTLTDVFFDHSKVALELVYEK